MVYIVYAWIATISFVFLFCTFWLRHRLEALDAHGRPKSFNWWTEYGGSWFGVRPCRFPLGFGIFNQWPILRNRAFVILSKCEKHSTFYQLCVWNIIRWVIFRGTDEWLALTKNDAQWKCLLSKQNIFAKLILISSIPFSFFVRTTSIKVNSSSCPNRAFKKELSDSDFF